MSSNAPPGQNVEWKPEPVHAVIRRFRRGPDKKKRFIGQQNDEIIRRIVREHPIFYVSSAFPLLLALAFFGLLVWLNTSYPQVGSIFPFLYLVSGIAILVAAVYCAYRIFELWWVNIDIITNKRILTWRGLLKPTRDETTLDKVQQIAVDQDSLLSVIFSFGLVRVYLAGGKALELTRVPDPKGIRDDIAGVFEDFKKAKPPKEPIPQVTSPELADVLAKLAKKEAVTNLPNADRKYEHRHSPVKLRGPLRTFGGPLRIACEVHYESDEYTVMYVQRSRWVLVAHLFVPVLLLLATLVGSLIARFLFGYFAIAFVILLVASGLIIINYVDDVFILTNKRIIDIERKYIFLFEQHDTTTYDKISKIEVRMHNIIEVGLNIGDLFIETQGSNPNITMPRISHPFFIQDKIYAIKGFKEKADKAKQVNNRKDELNLWFSTVLSTLETKIANRGVPNLQSLDLWTAVERAGEFGMKVIPVGESPAYPNIESGKIVSQLPPPGTLVHIDPQRQEKPLIQVVLSKRN